MSRLVAFALLLALALPASAADKDKDTARQKAAEKRFEKLKEYLKERRVSHVVEVLAVWGEFADANQQDDILRWVQDLREKEEGVATALGRQRFEIGYRGVKASADLGKKEIPVSAYFVDDYLRALPPRTLPYNEGVFNQLVVSSKALVARPNMGARGCVLLTNAAVAEFHGLDNCLVISSGCVSVTRTIWSSAVVCRGDMECVLEARAHGGFVWAGGKITDVNPVAKGRKKAEEVGSVEKDDKLLGMKFYSCTEDGLTATADAKAKTVTVSKLDAQKPFAKAGVKEGDVIESINGERVPTLHELDRLLCRATVASGVAKLTLKRGDKSELIEVKLADW
jgi:hypothetical protein